MATLVLLVSGAPVARGSNRAVLERAGYAVLEAVDADRAVDLARLHAPDAVVVEPCGTGDTAVQVAQRLRRLPRTARLPIVVLANALSAGQREALRELGCSISLREPCPAVSLLAELQYALLHAPAAAAQPVGPGV